MNYRPDIDIVLAKSSPGSGRCRDSTSKMGAEQNAADIAQFWHTRGYHQVRVWIEPVQLKSNARGNGGGQIWVVRTDLERGMPRMWPLKLSKEQAGCNCNYSGSEEAA